MHALRADINYQIAVKVNKVSQELKQLREVIALDVKKWASQRSDMQCDINKLSSQIQIYTNGKPERDPLHDFLIYNPYMRLRSSKGPRLSQDNASRAQDLNQTLSDRYRIEDGHEAKSSDTNYDFGS